MSQHVSTKVLKSRKEFLAFNALVFFFAFVSSYMTLSIVFAGEIFITKWAFVFHDYLHYVQ